jgi:hypothetical protein
MGFLKDLLSPAKRKAIYAVVAAVAVALVAFGIITQDQLDQWVQSASGVVAALAMLLAMGNVPSE